MTEDITKAPSGGGPDGAGKCQSRAAIDGRENKLNGRDPQGDSAPAPGALTHKRIVFLDADGVEIPPGSADVFAARTLGMSLLRNGTFRVVATYRHPNPPPPSMRRCKTKGGVLLAADNLPPPDAEEGAAFAADDAEKIDTVVDPPWRFDPEFALENPELYIWTKHEDGFLICERRPRDEEDEFFDEESAL